MFLCFLFSALCFLMLAFFRCFLFFYLLPCYSAWLQVQLQLHQEQHQRHKQQRAASTKGTTRTTNTTKATRTVGDTRTTTTAKQEHDRNCLCVPWGEAPPSALSIVLLHAFVFFPIFGFFALVWRPWWKWDGWQLKVSQCFKYEPNRMQNGRLKFKMLQISLAKSCTYHATWKVLSSKCGRCHAKWEVLSVDVAECWTYCKYHANICKLSCLFLCFFGLDDFASFLSSWLCKALRALWLHGFVCVQVFTFTLATSVRKSQTRPTPKQRPQHQPATPPTTTTTTTATTTTRRTRTRTTRNY